jgi:XTP/dITP diphosphohydrolase
MPMSMASSILIASNNAHKVQEFREIFAQAAASCPRLVTPAEVGIELDPEESAETYLENAQIKAKALWKPGLWVMADDSGLEVDALGGRPGVRSARYHKKAAGGDGSKALLEEMAGISGDRRTARFRAVIVLVSPDGEEHAFEGVCEGSIGFEKLGTGGFGFDPVFRVAGDTRHMAELEAEEKHRVSHRGVATRKMIDFLQRR